MVGEAIHTSCAVQAGMMVSGTTRPPDWPRHSTKPLPVPMAIPCIARSRVARRPMSGARRKRQLTHQAPDLLPRGPGPVSAWNALQAGASAEAKSDRIHLRAVAGAETSAICRPRARLNLPSGCSGGCAIACDCVVESGDDVSNSRPCRFNVGPSLEEAPQDPQWLTLVTPVPRLLWRRIACGYDTMARQLGTGSGSSRSQLL